MKTSKRFRAKQRSHARLDKRSDRFFLSLHTTWTAKGLSRDLLRKPDVPLLSWILFKIEESCSKKNDDRFLWYSFLLKKYISDCDKELDEDI